MSLKGVGENDEHHVVVEVNSFREGDDNNADNDNIHHTATATAISSQQLPCAGDDLEFSVVGSRKKDSTVKNDYIDADDVRDGLEKGYVEDIEKFGHDSFHITMTDSDDMHIKHRHPHDKKNTNNNTNYKASSAVNTTGSHVNEGYTMDDSFNADKDNSSLQPSNDVEDENLQRHQDKYNLTNRHQHHHHDIKQQQQQEPPQIFHMDVFSPRSRYRLSHQPKTIEDLEEGIVSPTYVTPPTSPPPPPLMNALSLSSASSSTPNVVGSKICREDQMYKPASFIEGESGKEESATCVRLDQSIDSVQFQDIFYPNFFTTFYSHFVDGSTKVLYSPLKFVLPKLFLFRTIQLVFVLISYFVLGILNRL